MQDPRVSQRDLSVPGADGNPDVPVRVYEPEGRVDGDAVILHIHGGAFVIGSLDQDDASCERLALATGRCRSSRSTTDSRPSIRTRLPSTTVSPSTAG